MVFVMLAEGFEEIEALTVVDVLRRAQVSVRTVSIKSKEVTGSHGITVLADKLLSEADFSELKMLVLPGGMPGTKNLDASGELSEALDRAVSEGKLVAAICAAPTILGKRGYLKGRRATCYEGMEGELLGAEFVREPVAVDLPFITSRGPATAMKFACELVRQMKGDELASAVYGAMLPDEK